MIMKLKVNTYGNVSPGFSSLVSDIIKNAAENMDMPPIYTLHLCKNMNNYDFAIGRIINKARSRGLVAGDSVVRSGAQTLSLLDCPETVLVEDVIIAKIGTLEALEGVVAHEEGHAQDYWENGIISVSFADPLVILPEYASGEYRAERNAINAGYSSGCLASRVIAVRNMMASEEGHEFNDFFVNLGSMGWRSAFMHNEKPPITQKQYIDKLWKKLVNSRKLEQNRRLLGNKEAADNPNLFANDSILEDFVKERMKEYGLRDGLILF